MTLDSLTVDNILKWERNILKGNVDEVIKDVFIENAWYCAKT